MDTMKHVVSWPYVNIYPFVCWHIGSKQCDEDFIDKQIEIVKKDRYGLWFGIGDLTENAIVGSKSDVYQQIYSPDEQIEIVIKKLNPIKNKGLAMVSGNHNDRTLKAVGLDPDAWIAKQLGVKYLGISGFIFLKIKAVCYKIYLHHNRGGGRTRSGKIKAAENIERITPIADAIFTGHTHITSRIPNEYLDISGKSNPPGIIKIISYSYVCGSALNWKNSYAEKLGLSPAVKEAIYISFKGTANRAGSINKQQIYNIIYPDISS